ncbi:hypothetical protein ABFY57_25195 [Paenibacillus polymyxa]|uniref:hypothetical protein n=1 Tax=Paenibacillus TaxID=44249 RepID=UPI00142DDBA3|nr:MULTISPECIES: hypothetical protein [unclassified Paenibacillus]KAF6614978.1 hypothetical protein HFE00_21800 [Paenibacillus sp. EKM101P]KAF6622301.1 hypothetical protein HFE03_14450 [Paenibacillus sp. EKM102P]KAF6631149.1 hypothetical protein HFE01_12505 [Paenibacillus sp. EKM10P]KAF6650324.1 hypothetical protein HFE02_06470 [Paenibacillus sp. EKM11P]
MQLKKYPNRLHVRKVIEQFMNSKDSRSFFQEQGILVQAVKRKDVAKLGADHYFSRKRFLELKEKIDTEHNYKKTGRIELPKEQVDDLKSALLEINGVRLDNDEENTMVTVSEAKNGDWKFIINYTEYKPSMIDLLDRTDRRVEVTVNQQKDTCSLDFDTLASNDYSKVTQVINYIHQKNNDIKFDFSEISLRMLSCEKRIQLFNEFFQHDHSPWKFEEIIKLKVKRDDDGANSEESSISANQLRGINSAIIDGKNLIENSFVKGTLDNGFYFSMATMRFENIETAQFIDVAIEFKSRPEKCETKLVNSGFFIEEFGGEILEENLIFESKIQDAILFEFKNVLYQIYRKLLRGRRVSFSVGKVEVKFIEENTEPVN